MKKNFPKLILKVGLIVFLGALGISVCIDFFLKKTVIDMASTYQKRQDRLNSWIEDQQKRKEDAISKIRSRRQDLIPQLKFVASLHPAYREQDEENLVRETAIQLLASDSPDEVNGALDVLSYFIDVKTMKKVIHFGSTHKKFRSQAIESLSFNPFLDSNDYHRGRKQENLKEFAEDKNITSDERKVAASAAKKIR
jgi:hypothetical protein